MTGDDLAKLFSQLLAKKQEVENYKLEVEKYKQQIKSYKQQIQNYERQIESAKEKFEERKLINREIMEQAKIDRRLMEERWSKIKTGIKIYAGLIIAMAIVASSQEDLSKLGAVAAMMTLWPFVTGFVVYTIFAFGDDMNRMN